MLLEQLRAQLRVAFAARLDETHVLLVRLLANRHLDDLKAEVPVAAVVQHPERLQRDVAPGGQIKRFVKAPVQLPPLPFVRLVHLLHETFRFGDLGFGNTRDGFGKYPRLQTKPDIERLLHFLDRQFGDVRALVRNVGEQTFAGKTCDRLADRHAAHAQFVRQRLLPQDLAWRQFAAQDPLTDRGGHEFDRGRADDLAGHAFGRGGGTRGGLIGTTGFGCNRGHGCF